MRSPGDGALRALTRLGRRAGGPLSRVPGTVWVFVAVVAAVLVGFAATVLPLLTTGADKPRAEVTGRLPDQLVAGRTIIVPVAVDNTSASIISPVCITASSDPAGLVDVTQAEFQGLNTVPFTGGRSCGGDLTGQETITVRLTVVARHAGTLRLSLAVSQRGTVIGPELARTLEVVR